MYNVHGDLAIFERTEGDTIDRCDEYLMNIWSRVYGF